MVPGPGGLSAGCSWRRRRRRRRGRGAARGGQQGPGRVAAWPSAAPLLPVSVSARAAPPPPLPLSCPAGARGRGRCRLHGDRPQRCIRRRRGPERPVRRPGVAGAALAAAQRREGHGFLLKAGPAGPEFAPRPRPGEPAPPPGRQARGPPPPLRGRRGRDGENGVAVPLRRGLKLSSPWPL